MKKMIIEYHVCYSEDDLTGFAVCKSREDAEAFGKQYINHDISKVTRLNPKYEEALNKARDAERIAARRMSDNKEHTTKCHESCLDYYNARTVVDELEKL